MIQTHRWLSRLRLHRPFFSKEWFTLLIWVSTFLKRVSVPALYLKLKTPSKLNRLNNSFGLLRPFFKKTKLLSLNRLFTKLVMLVVR